MRRFVWATFGIGGLAAIFVGVKLLAVMNFDETQGRYPGAMSAEAGRFNWLSAYKGYIHREAVYQTSDDVINVWRWYARRFGVESKGGMNAAGSCVQLTKTDGLVLFRRTVDVRLCSITHGTQVFFNQMVYFSR